MAFNFLAAAVVFVLSTGVNLLLGKPRVQRPKPEKFEMVKAREGLVVPQGYGRFVVPPNIVWWGDVEVTQFVVGSFSYNANVVGTLAHGPMTKLYDIIFGDKSLRFEPVTRGQGSDNAATQVIDPPLLEDGHEFTDPDAAVEFTIHARQMFGGNTKEGGVEGLLTFFPGGLNQPVGDLTEAYMQAAGFSGGTRRPGICYIEFGTAEEPFYWGTSPNPQNVKFVLQYIPTALFDMDLVAGYTSPKVGEDANPIEVIYDILASGLRGMGLLSDFIDLNNFAANAKTCFIEGLGISCSFIDQNEGADMIEDILKHINGVLRCNPLTGLFEIKLARADYSLYALPRVTNKLHGASYGNAHDIKIGKSSGRDLINDLVLTFREFRTGPHGIVEGEVLTTSLEYNTFNRAVYRTKSYPITGYVVYADGVELTNFDDYAVLPDQGWVYIKGEGAAEEGAQITIDYLANAVPGGPVEATARAQHLADVDESGEVRHDSYDYGMYTDKLNANKQASRLLQMLGETWYQASWKMDKTGHTLAPCDVVRLYYVETDADGAEIIILEDVPFRILEIDAGGLEEREITVTAMEDIFGDDILPIIPPGSPPVGTTRTAPDIVISQAPTSSITICLFPADTNFYIEIQRSTDSLGTGALTLSSTVPGISTCATDTQDVDTIMYYRARLVPTPSQPGFTAGAWTSWIEMTGVAGTPGSCVCTIPTVATSRTESAGTATLTLTITDPQERVSKVEFKTQQGALPESAWFEDVAAPYAASVARGSGETSVISYRVTYLNCSGTSVVDLVGTASYPAAVTEDFIIANGDFVFAGNEPVVIGS